VSKTALKTDDIEAAAASVLGCPVLSVEPAAAGGNNRVYRIATADGVFALKFYPAQADDRRDRLGQEYRALEFLAAHGVTGVPRPITRDPGLACAVHQWIEGAPVADPGKADVDAMVALADRLAALTAEPAAATLAPASAHCFSGRAVAGQIDERLGRLRDIAVESALKRFLDDEFAPRLAPLLRRAGGIYEDAGLDFDAELKPASLTLSPSDFGFHNALRTGDGSIAFVDFEYFGWDDPVKMVADALWHPGSAFTPTLARRFRTGAERIFRGRDGDAFPIRLRALYPLFGMIWCLIVLNEFLPEPWKRRMAAGNAGDPSRARARQLAAAKRLLGRVVEAADE